LRALILAAGLGTRLRPLTSVRAKAAVPVNGIPLVRRVMTWLVSEGVIDQVINLHHRPESIAAVVGDGGDLGARVRYSWEDPVLGSGGGPRHALPLLTDKNGGSDDAFVIVNGDTLTEMPLGALTDRHRQSGALITMALIPNPRPEFYGGVCVQDGWITGFTRAGTGEASYHFIGVQAAHTAAFSSLEDGVPAESVNSLYPRLIRESPYSVAACMVDATFSDIGTPADYLQTSVGLAAREGDRLVSGIGLQIDPGAALTRTAVWDNVRIEANCVLKDCIVCDGVQIGAGSRYERCALVPFAGQPIHPDERREGDLVVRRY
jgi:NDP-sugar pyrophosphorylase family protein